MKAMLRIIINFFKPERLIKEASEKEKIRVHIDAINQKTRSKYR